VLCMVLAIGGFHLLRSHTQQRRKDRGILNDPGLSGMAVGALPAWVAGRARVARLAVGEVGMIEVDLIPVTGIVAIAARPGPVTRGFVILVTG